MSVDLRRKVSTVANLTSQCGYCAAHACGQGDAFRGGINAQGRINVPLKLMPEDLSDAEKAAMRMTVSIVKVPAQMTADIRREVVKYYTLDGMQQIGMVSVFFGEFTLVSVTSCTAILTHC